MNSFSLAIDVSFIVQAIGLYLKRNLDWFIALNGLFATRFILVSLFNALGITLGLITVLDFIKPSINKRRNLKFRISHFVVLFVALIYMIG